MAKAKPAPIVHTERLLALVPYISANQGVAIGELAQAFEVTTAQMSADLTTLWMCGLPGYTALELMDLSFESGFVRIRNAPTLRSPRTLNAEEVISLLLGLDLVRQSLPDNSELATSVAKLSKRLSEKAGIAATFRATNPVSSSIRAEVEQSLAKQQLLEISYHSLYNDSFSERRITPLELRIDNGIEYLCAYCHSASAFRVFRLDRIQTLKVSSEKGANVAGDVSTQSSEFAAQIVFASRARLMKERLGLDDVALDVPLQIQSFSRQWIIRSIFASSGSVRLLEPADLGHEIAKKAQLILDRYQAHEPA
jgi:proteasome accessory factor C